MGNIKKHKISREIKEQILARIKNDGLSVLQAAEEHGVSTKTIYNWLGKGITSQPTIMEVSRLKRQNKELLELVGKLTMDLSNTQKRAHEEAQSPYEERAWFCVELSQINLLLP
jgi:transposase-like protein